MRGLAPRLRYWLLGNRERRAALERLPLGRQIAERHRGALFDDMAGVVRTQALLACLESGLFDALRDASLPRAVLADRLDLGADAFDRLLDLAEACGLIERGADACALTVRGLVVASERGVQAMIRHGALLVADLADWRVLLGNGEGGGALARFWPYAGQSGDADGYSALMRDSLSLIADPLCAAVDFDRYASILEVGGGDASLALSIAGRFARPHITVFDLPPVAALAQERIAKAGLGHRVSAQGRAPDGTLPSGQECVLLVRLLHDLDDRAALALFESVSHALAPGGHLIVAEPSARSGRDAQTAYFAAYFAAMRSGRLRRREALIALAARKGLKLIETAQTSSSLVSVLIFGHSLLSE